MGTAKILQMSLLLAVAVWAQKTETLSKAFLERLGYSDNPDIPSDLKYILQEPPAPMDRSFRPTSYYSPPVNQSPRYGYRSKYLKKRTSYKKEYVKTSAAKRAEEGQNPKLPVYLYERGVEDRISNGNMV